MLRTSRKQPPPRRRSFWGWGWEDRFGGRLKRRLLGLELRRLTGLSAQTPEEPARLEEVELPRGRLEVPERLAAFTTAEREARIRHTYGRSYPEIVRGFRGDFGPAPDLVASPREEREVEAVLEWAAAEGVAVVPWGGGTSVVGGVTVESRDRRNGVVALDLGKLDRLLEVDEVSRAARIEAGATGPQIEAQLGEHGLTLRHFPQSFELSTLGGWIATRSGGHFATLATHVDDLVESTRMLTPAGVMETRRLPASGAGPRPEALVCGSEGALGVVTEAWMRVRPRPAHRSRATVRFGEWKAAVDAVRAISQSGLHPANCRLLDAGEARLHGVARDGSHVLLLAFESAGEPTAERLGQVLAIALRHGGRCPEGPRHRRPADPGSGAPGASGRWKKAFFEAPYLQTRLVSLGVLAETFETACTWDRFGELHRAVEEELGEALRRVCGGGRLTSRFTHVYPDGPAPYYTLLAPVRRGAEVEQWRELKRAASEVLLAHGATITHHHAVGRTHRPWYEREVPAPFLEALRAAKRTLDPAGVLNPGVLVGAKGSPAHPGR